MFALIAQLNRWLALAGRGPAANDSLPQVLMERAEARAGLDPQQAEELRQAAFAYLSVVR